MSNRDSSTETRQASGSSNSAAETAYCHGQGCSLLFHPLGVLLLEYYYSLVYNRTPTPVWFSTLQKQVHVPLINFHESNMTETDLTRNLHNVFQEFLPTRVYREKQCSGTIYDWEEDKVVPNYSTSGRVDVVFSKRLTADTKQDRDDFVAMDVVGILEASVDKNGGSKKLSQAMKYAALVCRGTIMPSANPANEVSPDDIHSEKCTLPDSIHETKPTPAKHYVIVWTLHVYRSKRQETTEKSSKKSSEGISEGRQREGGQNKGNTNNDHKGWIQHMKILVYLCEVSWNPKYNCPDAKYALLWREFTSFPSPSRGEGVRDKNQWMNALEKGSRSIARAVAMVFMLTEFIETRKSEDMFSLWELKGPNCVKVRFVNDSKCFMLKVFDNRFAPTARSPFLWCEEEEGEHGLHVEPFLFFHESCAVGGGGTANPETSAQTCTSTNAVLPLVAYFRSHGQCAESREVKRRIQELSEDGLGGKHSNVLLGNPRYQRSRHASKTAVPYAEGTVVVLQYDYVEGSHWPECTQKVTGDASSTTTTSSTTLGSPRSFLPILDHLKRLHVRGLVHGDVRLFNMIFAKSKSGDTREKAWLLDFDLGGKKGARKYPIGYKEYLRDVGVRAGRSRNPLSCRHDLADFVGVLSLFVLKSKLLENVVSILDKLSVVKDKLSVVKDKLSVVKDKLHKEEKKLSVVKDKLHEEEKKLKDKLHEEEKKLKDKLHKEEMKLMAKLLDSASKQAGEKEVKKEFELIQEKIKLMAEQSGEKEVKKEIELIQEKIKLMAKLLDSASEQAAEKEVRKEIELIEEKIKSLEKQFDSAPEQAGEKEAILTRNARSKLASELNMTKVTIVQLEAEATILENNLKALLGDESIHSIWMAPARTDMGLDSRVAYLAKRRDQLRSVLDEWDKKRVEAAANPDRDGINDLLRVDEHVKLLFRNDASGGLDSIATEAFEPRGDDVDPGLYFTAGKDLTKLMDELQGKESKREPKDSASKKNSLTEATGSPDRSHAANLGGTGGSELKSANSAHTAVDSGSVGQEPLEAIPEDAKRDDDDEVVP